VRRSAIDVHHILGGPTHGWVHTHGLAQLGLPELEIRGVPAFLGAAASRLLVEVANHLAEGKDTAEAGVLIQLDKQPAIRLDALGPTDDYDADHFQAVRFCLMDATADDTAPGRSFPAMPFARA